MLGPLVRPPSKRLRRLALSGIGAWALCAAAAAQEPLSRIVFGSCFKTDRDASVWSTIAASTPDVVVLAGDNVYADTTDMDRMRASYEALDALPGFASLRTSTTLLATWDDHDYGRDDAGREYPQRIASQQVFLDFLRVPEGDPRRAREGVYHAEVFGPPGKRVQLVLLDTRYHRDPLARRAQRGERAFGRYGPYAPTRDTSTTLLGEDQWTWLVETLREPAEVRVVVSSIQFASREHGFEKWGNFPHERRRFLKLLHEHDVNGLLLVSGDRHHAELARIDPGPSHQQHEGAQAQATPELAPPYALYELTASSLNVPTRFKNEICPYRVGSPYFDANFGSLEIDWDTDDPTLTLRIHRAEDGRAMIAQRLTLSELRPRTPVR